MNFKSIFLIAFLMLLVPTIVSADYIDVYPFNDTYDNSASTATNYGTANILFSNGGGYSNKNTYFNFSINYSSLLPSNYVVDSAMFNFYVDSIYLAEGPMYIYNTTSDWSELTETYNTKPTSGTPSYSVNPVIGWNYNIDMTDLVNTWNMSSDANHGISSYTLALTDHYLTIRSRENTNKPYIRISYHIVHNASNYTLSGYVKDLTTGLAIQNVKVLIMNNYTTYSEEQITNSQGYWTSSNLSYKFNVSIPSTFLVQFSKIEEYENNPSNGGYLPVTVSSSEPTLLNITMQKCVSGFTCFYNKEYVTFKVNYQNGSVASNALINVYYNSVFEANATTDTYGYARILLFKSRYYYIVTSSGISTDSQYITPTLSSYPIILYTPILEYMNGVEFMYSTTNTSIWFNMTDPNNEITNLTIQIGNTTNISINRTVGLVGNVNFRFIPSNTTSEYKITYTYITTHYGNLTGSVLVKLKETRMLYLNNIPSWFKNMIAGIISISIVVILSMAGFLGAGIFFACAFLLILASMSFISADITTTSQFIVGIPVLGFFGILWQMVNGR